MERDLTNEEAERRAREVARRMLTTPKNPKSAQKPREKSRRRITPKQRKADA